MLDHAKVDEEVAAYRRKLSLLLRRFHTGELTAVGEEAQAGGDALICLMEGAPLEQRETIDYLIDRFEALRGSCLV